METTSDLVRFWEALHDLWLARGDRPMNEYDEGYTLEIGGGWYIAVNGTKAPLAIPAQDGVDATVEPYHASIWFNGWPAGIVSPQGGVVAHGDAANFETLLTALRDATERAQAEPSTAHGGTP